MKTKEYPVCYLDDYWLMQIVCTQFTLTLQLTHTFRMLSLFIFKKFKKTFLFSLHFIFYLFQILCIHNPSWQMPWNQSLQICFDSWCKVKSTFHGEVGFFGPPKVQEAYNIIFFWFLMENSILKIFGSVDVKITPDFCS